jgi:arylsulfatase A-like enzyme
MATVLLLAFSAAAQAPPNVLLLIADDLGPEFVGCYRPNGNPAATPVMDQLARQGVRFDRAYASAVCTPSRVCIQTGRHAFRSGVVFTRYPGDPGLRDEELLLPEALAGSGYAMGMVGKWHVGALHGAATPNVQGWPYFVGAMDGGLPSYTNWPKVRNGQVTNCRNYATVDVVDESLAWIAQQQQPWLLMVSFNAPHAPFHAPPAALHGQNLAGLDPTTTPIPFYKAMIEALDHEIGRLLQGIGPALANTNVLLFGDNGTPGEVQQTGVSPLRAKGSLYETGCRIPFIACGPAVVHPGRSSSQLVHVLDIYPTVLQLCGVDPAVRWPNLELDGVSLLPALRNQPVQLHDKLYNEVIGTSYGTGYYMQRGSYKLIRFTGDANMSPHEEMYSLLTDPMEANDLLASPISTTVQTIHQLLTDDLWRLRHQGHALLFGTGCAGQAGGIRPDAFVPPTIGMPYSMVVTRLVAGPPLTSCMLMGWSREVSNGAPLPLDLAPWGMAGCSLLVSTDQVQYFGPTDTVFFLQIPASQRLSGVVFHAQGFALDPTANALGMISSPAHRIIIGE